jgi:hypothetical protein
MYNKKALSKATAELDKAKAPKKPKDIITDPMGQWKYPGLPTRIPGNDITMQGVGYPVLGVANNGQRKIMLPGADYTFPGAEYVDEYPQMRKGGERKRRKTKSISGTNKIMQKNPLFKDYKNRVYDPNVDYFQKGGVKGNWKVREELYDGEDEYFRANPHVGGMAAEDDTVILNPYSKLSKAEKDAIIKNEKARLTMRNGYARPDFNLTEEQAKAFENYSPDLQDQKETIVGRILSGDPSQGNATKQQREYAEELQRFMDMHKDTVLTNTSGPRNFQDGGPQNNTSEERFKKRLMKRYPGMQGVYGTDGENLSIIKDPNYKASDHGFGNIEFMFPGQDSVTYTDDYQYKNPTPDQYTTVYNPKGANRGDVFLDMMHGMRDDEEYQKLLQNFGATVKKGRGRDMDHWYNVEAQENPNYVEDGREVWDNNYIDGILRAELANKTIGRRVKGNDYKLERRGSTDEIKQAAKDIKKYLKTPQKPKQYVGPVIENNGFITPEYEDGGYIEADLTDDEIEEYRKGGYIVEDISVPELNQAQKGGSNTTVHTDKNGTKTTKYRDSHNVVHYKVETKDGKVYNKQDKSLSVGQAANDTRTPTERAIEMQNFYKAHPGLQQDYLKPGTAAYIEAHDGPMQSVDDFWTLPIGMTSAGVKGTVGLAKGLTSLGRNALKSSLVQSGKAGTKALLNKSLVKSLPGSSINNLVASGFAGTALTDIVTGKVAEPWKKANKSGKGSDYADAVAENMFTALDAYPLYNAAGKGLKQLGKYAKTLPGKLSKTKANSIPKRATSIGLDTYSGDSFTPIRIGGKKYKHAGQEWYNVDPGDYPGMTWEETQKQGLQDAGESLNYLFKKNPNYSKEIFDNVGDFDYKQFSEGDEALKKLKSAITSEPIIGKADVYSNTELQKKIQNYKNWRNEIDEIYKEYKKLDPSGNSSNSDLRNLHPHLKKRWDALKNIDKSITDKFITKEQEKLIRENYPELISTLDTRNDLSRHSLKILGEDKLKKPMPQEAIDILKSLNLYKKPNKNLLRFEPGKMNKLGGLVKAQKGGIVLKLTSKEIQDYIKQGYIVEDVE